MTPVIVSLRGAPPKVPEGGRRDAAVSTNQETKGWICPEIATGFLRKLLQ